MKNCSLFGLLNLGSQGKPTAHIPSASAFYLNTREKVSSHSQTVPSILISDYLKINNMLILQRQRPAESLEQDIHST